MLKNYLKWRSKFGPFPEIEAQAKKMKYFRTNVMVASPTRDKFGRSILYWTARNHNSRVRSLVDIDPFVVHLFESCIANLGPGATQFLCVADLSGFQMRHADLSFVNKLVNTIQSLIPERMGTTFVVLSPWFFSALWSVIRGWLDERTTRKVHFLGKNHKEVLNKFLDDDQIPVCLGGTMPNIEPEFDIWQPLDGGDEEEEDEEESAPPIDEPQLEDEGDENAMSEKLAQIEIEQRQQVEAELKAGGKKKKKRKNKKNKKKSNGK